MTGRGTYWQMMRVGRGAAASAEAGRIRYWALLLASFLTVLSICGLVLAAAGFDARSERGAARSPRLVEAFPQEQAVALWRNSDDLIGNIPHDVIYITPLTPDAPPPPGLSRWPEPGQAFLSPALREISSSEQLTTRYGRFAGIIGEEGLEAPGERLAYVAPTAELLDRKEMFEISGFGGPGVESLFGEHVHNYEQAYFYAGYIFLVILPTGLLVVVAVRAGAAARDRRITLLDALGATWRARACFAVGEAAVPVAVGTALAVVALAPACAWNVPVPGTEFILSSDDTRQSLSLLALVVAAVPATVLGLAAVFQPRRQHRKLQRAAKKGAHAAVAAAGLAVPLRAALHHPRRRTGSSDSLPARLRRRLRDRVRHAAIRRRAGDPGTGQTARARRAKIAAVRDCSSPAAAWRPNPEAPYAWAPH